MIKGKPGDRVKRGPIFLIMFKIKTSLNETLGNGDLRRTARPKGVECLMVRVVGLGS